MREISLAGVASWNKGLGSPESASGQVQARDLHWNLLREDLSLPTAVLYEHRLLHNLDWMQRFLSTYGVKLAPHGKTTMAPKLFAMQMETGAWGMTLATAQQAQIAYQHGVKRVLMANQLVGLQNMAIISRLLRDPAFDFYCLVDSAELVNQLGRFYSSRKQRLNVLIELGVAGGRTGIRGPEQLTAVLDSLLRWRGSLSCSGVEVYEGVLEEEAAVRGLLGEAVGVARQLLDRNLFDRAPFLLSGAGSSWYDVVAEVFSAADFGSQVEIVLRPGCYLTHDVGVYSEAQAKILQRNPIARKMRSGLLPALQVWAYVQSVPEKTRAIIGMGKRDAAFDSGLPRAALHFRPGTPLAPENAAEHWQLTRMMDQHAYLTIAPGDDVQVGDMIGFDISHPCLTFDKWRTLVVLDPSFNVVDVIETFF